MKTLLVLFFIVLSAFAAIEEEEDVLVLTDANYLEALQNEHILIEFYAPWCGHCQTLAPEYAKAAKVLKETSVNVPLAKCDATLHKEFSGKYDIQGFPTIKFFTNGKDIEFNGGRTADEIVNWVTKRVGEPTTLVADQAALDALIVSEKLLLVLFTDSVEGETFAAFKQAAMENDKVTFVYSTDATLAADNQSQFGQLVLFKQFDEKRHDYSEEISHEKIQEFLSAYSLPSLMDFDDSAIEVVFQQGSPSFLLFADTNEASQAALKAFETVANERKANKVKFIKVTQDNEHWDRLAEYIQVDNKNAPAVILIQVAEDIKKYLYTAETQTIETYTQFLEDYEADKLTPTIQKDEEEPNQPDAEGIPEDELPEGLPEMPEEGDMLPEDELPEDHLPEDHLPEDIQEQVQEDL